jgi:hypothetical protein
MAYMRRAPSPKMKSASVPSLSRTFPPQMLACRALPWRCQCGRQSDQGDCHSDHMHQACRSLTTVPAVAGFVQNSVHASMSRRRLSNRSPR